MTMPAAIEADLSHGGGPRRKAENGRSTLDEEGTIFEIYSFDN